MLTYENALAKTPFCRLSNGSTRDGREALGSEDYPYLKIVDCPLDIESKEQIQTITIDDMDAEVTGVDTAGYVLSVRVGNDTVSGEEFRTNYHLASSCFSFQKYDGKLRSRPGYRTWTGLKPVHGKSNGKRRKKHGRDTGTFLRRDRTERRRGDRAGGRRSRRVAKFVKS